MNTMTRAESQPIVFRISELLESREADEVELIDWDKPDSLYVFRVFLLQELEGGFSARCPDLPGVASQGETVEEAIGMISDALNTTLLAYARNGMSVPWMAPSASAEEGEEEFWISIDV